MVQHEGFMLGDDIGGEPRDSRGAPGHAGSLGFSCSSSFPPRAVLWSTLKFRKSPTLGIMLRLCFIEQDYALSCGKCSVSHFS